MDSVIGKAEGTGESCLVMTDRKTRGEIIIKARSKTAADTVHALQWLKCQIGRDWKLIFHTITNDNGSEFAELESVLNGVATVYYAHPYRSSERGTNEVHNKMVRRDFPKGQSLDTVSPAAVAKVEAKINQLPRRNQDYRTTEEVFSAECKRVRRHAAKAAVAS